MKLTLIGCMTWSERRKVQARFRKWADKQGYRLEWRSIFDRGVK